MKAEEIVRLLADAHPCEEVGDMWHICVLCRANLPTREEDHAEDCPWRLASEWVSEHKGV